MHLPRLPGLLLLLIPPSLARTHTHPHPHPPRDFATLDDALLPRVASADPQPWTSVNEGHLGRMLVPRPAGSEGNAAVREYIRGVFERIGWHVEQDTFTGKTPEGDIEFTNLIATYDREAERKVVLAAHHDSKWFPDPPESEFIGATDSAAPCAMLLDLAEFITPSLDARRERLEDDDDDDDERDAARTTLQMVFFDGEEAFHDWTATDSIYGSRHLAEQWEFTFLPPTHPYHATHPKRRMDPNPTVLHTIEHLILLDLLGSSHPRILKWYRETGWLFDEMRRADERLRASGLVVAGARAGDEWFSSQVFGGTIEDDQVPFIERGVNVFHVIPYPFPTVWHTIKDDATALDMPTMHRWNLILRVFTLEYLGLPPPPVGASRQKRSDEETTHTHTHTRHREL